MVDRNRDLPGPADQPMTEEEKRRYGPTGGPANFQPSAGRTGSTGQSAAGVSYNPRTGISSFQEGATTGDIEDPYAWGGVSGAVVRGLDGNLMVDPNQSGRQRDVNRYRDAAEKARGREAFKMDFTKGDEDRGRADATRGNQGVASSMLADAAHGGAPSGAVIRGQGATDDAFGAALGAQAGAKGGAVNQAAATTGGTRAAAHQQLGVADKFGGARSAELTSARGAYSQGTNAMRTGDYQQQALDQQRQRSGLANEMTQRELNQNREMGYEGLAYDVNINSLNAGLKDADRVAGIRSSALQREQAQADRMATFYNKGIGEAGKLGGSLVSDDDK